MESRNVHYRRDGESEVVCEYAICADYYIQTNHRELFFDAAHAKPTFPSVRPMEEQEETESQRLWSKVTNAIRIKDQNVATDEKTRIEDAQRELAAQRGDAEWKPRLFTSARNGTGLGEGEEGLDWIISARM